MQVVTVGMGEPKHAARYCGKFAPSITCLADESHAAYATYGLHEASGRTLLSADLMKAGMRAFQQGHRQTANEAGGNKRMLPGTFIVDAQGIVKYAYYSKHPGDHPHPDEVIRAATGQPSQA